MSDTPNPENRPLAIPEVQPPSEAQQLQQAMNGGGFLTSIDTSTAEGKFQAAEIMLGKGQPVEEWINKEFEVCNYLLTIARFVEEATGEEVTTTVSRVIMADGDWIETHSRGVLKTLGMMVQLFGPAPWSPGIPAKLVRRAIRGGRSWCVLELVRRKVAAQVEEKKGGKRV